MASKRKAHLTGLQQEAQALAKAAAKAEKKIVAEILEDAADGVLKHKNRDAAKKLLKKDK